MWNLLKDSNTVKALIKIKDEVRIFSKIADYLLQIIFIGYYSYSIAINLDNNILLIINIILLSLSLVYFLYAIIRDKMFCRKTKRTINRFYRYSKLFIRVFTIGFSVYTIMNHKHSDLQVLITIFTVISFIIQVMIEAIRFLIDRYVDMLMDGIAKDKKYIEENGGLLKIAGKTMINNYVVAPVKEKFVLSVRDKTSSLITLIKNRREKKKNYKKEKKLAKKKDDVKLIPMNNNDEKN